MAYMSVAWLLRFTHGEPTQYHRTLRTAKAGEFVIRAPSLRTKWPLKGIMVHMPDWNYNRIWSTATILWFIWSLRMWAQASRVWRCLLYWPPNCIQDSVHAGGVQIEGPCILHVIRRGLQAGGSRHYVYMWSKRGESLTLRSATGVPGNDLVRPCVSCLFFDHDRGSDNVT